MAPGAFPHSSSAPMSGLSQDGGTLELGIESAWTRDDTFITGLSTNSVLGALRAPSDYSSPPITHSGDKLHMAPLTSSEDSEGSAMMSISLLLECVVGQCYTQLELVIPDVVDPKIDNRGQSPQLSEKMNWADLPNNDELGDFLEYPILSPIIEPGSTKSSLRIPYASKGKLADTTGKDCNTNNDLNEWYYPWTESENELPDTTEMGNHGPL
ncbi:hypothetical protein DFH29DRAFT_998668 [Suillus ampliporus]|nr:hypothetical protein DFH29DRAFT_998668 [Suillus ampliporus]